MVAQNQVELSNMYSKKFTYESLSHYQKLIFEEFIEKEIQEGRGIASILTDHTSLRSKTRLAGALLFRNQEGDKENATIILKWILSNQYQDETSKNYGIWKTSVVNDKFDQNWREFIGCDLIIIRHKYKMLLSEGLLKEIEMGLIHAAKGAFKRNVAAGYTNISIMSSFLMEYVGTEFKMDELKNAGLQKARDVFSLYQMHHTFSEYNSPTYYGVTFIGLALWRELAFSTEIQEMGKVLEKEFWHEVATFYNPNLKNMPGPYFRGYGMDMQKYFAIAGLWIAIAVDDEKSAPMPKGDGPKYGEMSNLAPIFSLGLSIPKADLSRLQSFSEPHFISRSVPNSYKGDTLKKVTAMVYKDWMMGGLWGNKRIWNQIKTGTIHWKTAQGDIAWLMVPGDGKTNVTVNKSQMIIYAADSSTTSFELYIYAKDVMPDTFKDKKWGLPGMILGIHTALTTRHAEKVDSGLFQEENAVSENYPYIIKVVYKIPAPWKLDKPLLKITPKISS